MGRKSSCARVFADERGSVLIGGLFLVLAVTLMGLGLYQASVVETRQVAITENDVRAQYAAESGLNQAALDVAWDTTVQGATGGPSAIGFCELKGCTGLTPPITGTLPDDNTTLTTLYDSRCFGSATCDSSNPTAAAFLVQAQNDTADADRFWLISTGCIPGPAANPCPAGAKSAAQVKAFIKQGPPIVTTSTTSTVTTTTTTHAAFPAPLVSMNTNCGSSACIQVSGHSSTQIATDSFNSRASGCTVPCGYNAALPGGGTNLGNDGSILGNGNMDVTGQIHGSVIGTTNVVVDPVDINLANGTHVYGQVVTGGMAGDSSTTCASGTSCGGIPVDGGIVTNHPQAQITGTSGTCGSTYPTAAQMSAAITWNNPGSGSWSYNASTGALVINGGANLTLAPGTYCLGTFTEGGGSSVLQITGFTVIWTTGSFTQSGGSFVNTTNDPQNFQVITMLNDPTHTNVTVSGGSAAYMTIYAPLTNATISGGTQIFGAVAADNITISGGGTQIHYDDFLGSGLANIPQGVNVTFSTTTTTTSTITTTTFSSAGYSLVTWQQSKCTQPTASSSWSCS